MKKLFCLILLTLTLSACSGGGSDAPAAPAVDVTTGNVSRMVVNGSSAAIDVTIKPNFAPGNLYVTVVDSTGVLAPAVSVTPDVHGSYTISLSTASTAAAGRYTGTLTLNLFSDAARTIPQQVPSITVPVDIYVLSSTSSWPGNNLTPLSPWPAVADWSMYQGNAAHTGYVPVTVDPNKFTPRWSIPAVVWAGGFFSGFIAPTTADGQFFLVGNNMLYARSEYDASLNWQYDFSSLQNPSVNPPAVAKGVVYLAAGQQDSTFFFALSAIDGSVKFKAPMSSQWEHYLPPTIGTQGIYTNAGTYGGLYAFDQTGTQMYFAPMAQTSMWTPAVDAAGVYTYTGGVLKVVDPKSGAVLHSIADPTFTNYVYEIDGSPVLGAPGSVFAANYANSILNNGGIGNTLTNFNTVTNTIGWQVSGDYPTTPAYADGVLYAVNNSPVRLEARAERDGSLLWSWTPPLAGDTNFVSEVLLTNNLVFVSTNLATYAIDRSTHKTVWSYPLPGRFALSRNGILYIQSGHVLAAINLK